MASTVSLPLFGSTFQFQRPRNAVVTACKAHVSKPAPSPPRGSSLCRSRRELLFSLTVAAVLTARDVPSSMAEDIPLFGIKKKLRKAEEEAVEIVKEGFEATEKGIEAAEKGFEAAERGVEAAEREVEAAVSFGGLAQAGVVAGAEVVGVLVATSVVNGILGPEAATKS